MSPNASRQSTAKMTNRPHFAHVLGHHLHKFEGSAIEGPKVRTRSATTRDKNLQFRGAVSTGFF